MPINCILINNILFENYSKNQKYKNKKKTKSNALHYAIIFKSGKFPFYIITEDEKALTLKNIIDKSLYTHRVCLYVL